MPFVLATVVLAERPTSGASPATTALVLADGTIEGFVGGACAESTVRAAGAGAAASRRAAAAADHCPERRADARPSDGAVTVDNPCLSGGTLEIFLEPRLPAPLVVVAGDAPIAEALVELGAAAGLRRASGRRTGQRPAGDAAAVVVASHGRDEERGARAPRCDAGVPYVGLVASRRRGAAVLRRARLSTTSAGRGCTRPAGLDIGARTRRGDRAVDPGRDRRRPHRRAGGPRAGAASSAGSGTDRDRRRPGLRDDRGRRRRVLHLTTTASRVLVLRHRLPTALTRRPGPLRLAAAERSAPGAGAVSDVAPLVPTSRRCAAGSTPPTTSPTRAWRRRCSCAVRLPPAAPARGRGRGRQDRGGQGAGRGAGHAADPAAVLRGHRRRRGAVRVELPAPAAGDPAGRGARRRRWPRTTCSAATTCCAARCCRRSSTPARGRPCC